jgi:hypothetical protein
VAVVAVELVSIQRRSGVAGSIIRWIKRERAVTAGIYSDKSSRPSPAVKP